MEAVELKKELSVIEQAALDISVVSQETYERAGILLREIKGGQSKVKDYWEPMRVSAKEAYDAVLARKKEMLDPMDKAEKILKDKMRVYMAKVEEDRRKREEELRRQAFEEAQKKLAEAEAARILGDDETAEVARMEASVMENASLTMRVDAEKPKTDGISMVKTWEIVEINPEEVPISVMGVEIRPVDQKAVMALIKGSKGMVQIPGIKYKETSVVRARK